MTIKPETGSLAPDFTLPDHNKEWVKLSDQQGTNVLLLFFPFAFTSTCTKELCDTRDSLAFYAGAGTRVFGISVDSPYTLKKFREDLGLQYPLLSDFNKDVSRAYDILYESFGPSLHGVSKRSAFVIDREGVIRYAEVLENAGALPDFKKIREIIQSLS